MTAISKAGISSQRLQEAWKAPLILASLVFAWLAFLYWPTAWSMVSIWARSDTFAHGFVVLPTVLWLAWRRRDVLVREEPVPSRLAMGLLLPAGGAWLLGELAAARVLAQLAMVALAALSVPALLGWRVARRLAFPLGFLFFAVPMGEFLLPQLMDWTARFTVLGLRWSGVPVYQDGLEFVIPSGTWSVVEACSGIRYLIASVMAGTLFAYLNFHSPRRRLAFVGVAVVVPVVANWVRAYLIVMLGHLSGNRLAMGADHLIYGWIFFGVVITAMFLIGSRWAEAEEPGPEPAGPASPAAAGGRPLDWKAAGLVALTLTLPVLALSGMAGLNRAAPPALAGPGEAFASRGWQPAAGSVSAWQPGFRDAADIWRRAFEQDGRLVEVYVAYYRNQGHDHKLVASTNTLLPSGDAGWTLAAAGSRPVRLDGQRLEVNTYQLKPKGVADPGLRQVVWQWYWVAGRLTPSPLRAKAYTAWSRLLGEGDDAAVIVLHAPADQPGGGTAALDAFTATAGEALNRMLEETRRQR